MSDSPNPQIKSRISLIVAMAKNRAIGRSGSMPWHMPADLGHFKSLTLGKPILMGRRTHEAIGKALPQRHNIILTHDRTYTAAGCTIVHSLQTAMEAAGDVEEIMVIGGATLYAQTLPQAKCIYLTRIDATPEADTFFPQLDISQWCEISRERRQADAKNLYDCEFIELWRKLS